MTCLRCHAHPFEFALQGLTTLRGRLLFLCQSLALLFQPRRVVTLLGDALATVEFKDPLRHIIEEITVVGHGDDRTLILLQMLL